jgi:hypothetical protein
MPILDYFRIADHPPGIGVSLEVEHNSLEMGNSSAHRLGETANLFALIMQLDG